ncbi:IS30 family transposase [Palleronia aestuarii]|uniref:IS30 family transposase n=1 Tax=Palleronia aestuarii TaxID=568105 RepID=A0A2W7MTK2_9RHOB|nr:helix-turn-helix domain-containing protein [Palleronia aestuarii]PZX10873.1 IS30 family transposase [Palleronia aestuarii]
MGRCYPHLDLEERRKLTRWLDAKMPVRETAEALCRAPSTIYRKLKRNLYRDDELPQLNG